MTNKESCEKSSVVRLSGSVPAEANDSGEAAHKQRMAHAQIELLKLLARACAQRLARPAG